MSKPVKQAGEDAWAVVKPKIVEASAKYPKPSNLTYAYGTAGFRMHASKLPCVMFRTALLAVLRSKKFHGQTIGIMVTASHNPAADNGVKIVDPSGDMLEQSWEAHATELANSPTAESLVEDYKRIADLTRVSMHHPASIVFARDTRPSGVELIDALKTGLEAFGETVKVVDIGITTTPVLHYVVSAQNKGADVVGEPTVDGYLNKMAKAFNEAVKKPGPLPKLYVDCANGVGINALSAFSEIIGDKLPIEALNTDTANPAILNSQCGADYVKTKQALPPSVEAAGYLQKPGTRGCSYDGDADRIVYYYLRDGKHFRLLDGDKIAVLVTMFLVDLVNRLHMSDDEKPKVGVVQTAYANGSSTKYLRTRGIRVECVPTGVKHLHHAARHFDIGVYFEANGHGTVLFSEECMSRIRAREAQTQDSLSATRQILAFSELINQTVGDALSDMLMVEAILALRQWGASEWDMAYEDLPNRLLKVEVPDRNIFLTTDAERKLTSPPGLQKSIDDEVNKYEGGRGFVRPSGTEDCVRVYAEATSPHHADALAKQIAYLVRHASGSV